MKRLILCADGTWNSADQEKGHELTPTNVVKLAVRIAKSDGPIPQIVFYDQGVGTGNALDRFTGGAFGEGLEDNIHDAYRFLLANYEQGDAIYLFGFSRGAFTARSIAGMVRKCGILRHDRAGKYPEAIALYRDPEVRPDDPKAIAFRTAHSVGGADGARIEMIGVWDTVGALGIPLRGLRSLTRKKHQFHDTVFSGIVRRACHALAIDEHRGPFAPTLWSPASKPGQTIEQVWFCGAHSDVGGGYAETGLSDAALEWMLAQGKAAGLAQDQATIAALPLRADPRGMLHDSKKGLYNVTPGIDRPIGWAIKKPDAPDDAPPVPDPTQSVHPTVLARWDGDPSYRPANLRDYFKRTGDPRGGG